MTPRSSNARFPILGSLFLCSLFACQHTSDAPQPEKHLELVAAVAAADQRAQISAELSRAQHDGKRLVVYVGATWCEPCREFHAAAEAGKLDATFPELRLLVFDADRDTEALRGAGYISDLIPLFAIPHADGMASGHQIEGSKTGTDAVAEISPRLRALLDGPQ